MTNLEGIEKKTFLWNIFEKIRRRGFAVGLNDYMLLWQVMREGIGWTSREELRDLCCCLWAKSYKEKTTLVALFNQIEEKDLPNWELIPLNINTPEIQKPNAASKTNPVDSSKPVNIEQDLTGTSSTKQNPIHKIEVSNVVGLNAPGFPDISLNQVKIPERSFVFTSQYPLTYREIAQTWRRLRKPIREGPKVEMDIEATINTRARRATISPVELTAKRINTAKLLLLIDSRGSMIPFHDFIEEFCQAIEQSCRFSKFAKYYFHNLLSEGSDETVLSELSGVFITRLDPVLNLIQPNEEGYIYEDVDQLKPLNLANILKNNALGASVVIISDAGAAKKRFSLEKLLNIIAFLKALNTYTKRYVWLNPYPKAYWQKSTASEIARHILMFPLDKEGIYDAVNALRGQVYPLERSL